MALPKWAVVSLLSLVILVPACAGSSNDGQAETEDVPPSSLDETVGVETTAGGESLLTSTPQSDVVVHSQSAQDADRDGVAPAVAALSFEDRVSPLVQVPSDDGTWMLSRLSPRVDEMADGCRFGSPSGQSPEEVICTVEYGEVLLVGEDREIIKAVPLPAMVPSWILVTDEWVYAGRVGDGALPDSGVVRVERATGQATVVVVPAPFDGGDRWPADWHLAPGDLSQDYTEAVGFTADGATGVATTSWIGDIVIDPPAIDAFIDRVLKVG